MPRWQWEQPWGRSRGASSPGGSGHPVGPTGLSETPGAAPASTPRCPWVGPLRPLCFPRGRNRARGIWPVAGVRIKLLGFIFRPAGPSENPVKDVGSLVFFTPEMIDCRKDKKPGLCTHWAEGFVIWKDLPGFWPSTGHRTESWPVLSRWRLGGPAPSRCPKGRRGPWGRWAQ